MRTGMLLALGVAAVGCGDDGSHTVVDFDSSIDANDVTPPDQRGTPRPATGCTSGSVQAP